MSRKWYYLLFFVCVCVLTCKTQEHTMGESKSLVQAAIGLLILLAIPYVVTTIILFARTGGSTLELNMLQAKYDMLQAQVGTADLGQIGETNLVESGNCQLRYSAGVGQSTITYNYYSYTLFNLTRYFVEFDGSTTGLSAVGASTDAACPGGTQTQRSYFEIVDCTIDSGGNVTVTSQINLNLNTDQDVKAFSAAELAKITFSGANAVVSANGGTFGPCSPGTYIIDINFLTGTTVDGFRLKTYIFTTDAPTFSLTLNTVRVAVPNALTISK